MGWTLYFCFLVVITLSSDIFVSGSSYHGNQAGQNSRAKRSLGLAPTTFAEKTLQKRALRAHNKVKAHPQAAHPASQASSDEIIKITAPFCKEEGIMLIQGENNYFMKCKINPVTGGYFQIIYVCPSDMHSVDDTSKCIPPPDCKDCAAKNAGSGGAEDIYGSAFGK